MRISIYLVVIASLVPALLSGCAGVTAVPAAPGQPVHGIPIYELRPILIVDGSSVTVKLIPNYNRRYGLRIYSFLAKNHSTVSTTDGIVSSVDADLDSTAAIELVKLLVTEGAKLIQPGSGLSGPSGAGAPQRFGIYDFVFDDHGNLVGLQPLILNGYGLNVVPKPSSNTQFTPLPHNDDQTGGSAAGGKVVP